LLKTIEMLLFFRMFLNLGGVRMKRLIILFLVVLAAFPGVFALRWHCDDTLEDLNYRYKLNVNEDFKIRGSHYLRDGKPIEGHYNGDLSPRQIKELERHKIGFDAFAEQRRARLGKIW
jgi:hypothetical protein